MSVEIQLEAHGIRVEYVIGQFEESAEGRLLKGLMSEFAEYEREKIKERTYRGILRSVESGNVTIGGCYAPYGYDLITENGRRMLVVKEDEAAIVRLIFDLYVNQGFSLYGVRDHLDAHHVPKPSKGNNHKPKGRPSSHMWSIGTINNILDNETYIGRWYYRKSKQGKDPITGKKYRIDRPREEWIEIAVPVILEESIFNAAKIIRDNNKRVKGKQHKNFYLLGGMLSCGHCGNNVSGMTKHQNGVGYGYYKCNAHHLPKKYGFKCDNAQFKVPIVDRAVWEYVKAIYSSPDTLQTALGNYQATQAEAQAPRLQMIEATAARLEETEREKTRLVQAYAAGVLTLEDIAGPKVELDKRLSDLTQALTELRAELQPNMLSQNEIDRIQKDAADLRAGLELAETDPATQRRILEQLLVNCRLSFEDGVRWIEIDSILGPARLQAEYNSLGSYDFALTQNESNHANRRCIALWQTARHTYSTPRYTTLCRP
jgi:site-specific DNA recombinase